MDTETCFPQKFGSIGVVQISKLVVEYLISRIMNIVKPMGVKPLTAYKCGIFSNKVKIPGEPTIPEDMAQNDIKCVGQAGAKNDHPWNAPGTAPVFGPCGTLGGNPFGCHGNKTGHFGDCCGNNCDGFALGKNAETYDWPGTVALAHQKVHDKTQNHISPNNFQHFFKVFCF